MTFDEITFDSLEEEIFSYYLQELKDNNFIDTFEYNNKSFVLSESVKYKWINKSKEKESTLLQSHIYTPDFYIKWNKLSENIFYKNTLAWLHGS